MNKVSAQTVQSARRSGVGRTLYLTEADRKRLEIDEKVRQERLARIAARSRKNV